MTIKAWEHLAVIRGYEAAAKFWEVQADEAQARHWRRLARERRKEIHPVTVEKRKS